MVAQVSHRFEGLIEKNTRFLRYRKLRLSEGRIRTGEQCDAERTFFALRQPNWKPKRQNTDLHNLPCLQGCLCPECLVWEDWSSRRQSIPWRIACPLILQHPRRLFSKTIDSIGEKELDSLPYGVIQLDAQGTVLRYNSYEEGLSGLTRQKVVGKNFFKQIAPCTDMQEFYGRFREGVAAGEPHCTFRYHFAFKRNPRDVTITLLYNAREKLTWVLVQPIDSQT